MRAAGEQTAGLTALSPPCAQTPPPLVPGFWGRWQHKSTSHWGLGLHFVGQWTAAEAATPCHSDHAALTPPAFLTLLVVSANREVDHYWKHREVFVYCQNKMHLLFSTIPASQRGPPKPLLRNDGFPALFLRFDDYSLSTSGGRSTQIIYISKIAVPHNNQCQYQMLHY